MKIAFYSADVGNHRFITPIIEKLQAKGYECQLHNNWTIDETADILFFDFCDNNLIVASRDNAEFLKSKKVIARLHSVEAYMGFYKQIDWSCVDHLIFVSDHMKRKCADADYRDCQIHVIHNGIDLERFTFTPKTRDSSRYLDEMIFGYIGNIVPQKGLLTFLHYFATIRSLWPDAKFYLAGLSRMHGREGEYWEYMKEKIGNIFEESEGVDTNKWLEEKNILYLVQPSYAESFSLIIGEAMAKGIKPMINNYWGSEELWPPELIYSDFKSFCDIIEGPYESQKYRDWVGRYEINKQVTKIEELFHD